MSTAYIDLGTQHIGATSGIWGDSPIGATVITDVLGLAAGANSFSDWSIIVKNIIEADPASDPSNTPIVFSSLTGPDLTTGDGSVRISVLYTIEDLL